MNHASDQTRVALVALDGQPVPDSVPRSLAAEEIDLTIAECTNRAELILHAATADVVWLFGGSRVLMDGNLSALDRCWAIIRTGSGTDNIPVDEATSRGIVVANTPAAFCDAVSDHVVAMMFATARRIVELDRSMRRGEWLQGTAIPLSFIKGRTLGLVGFGHVGREITRKLSGFEMTVLVHDPYVDPQVMAAHGALSRPLDAVLSESDFISLHCPLTPKTIGLIGERELRLIKPTAILINTSRGPVVNEPALIRALQEHRIAAAGLDVFAAEPPAADNPLLKLENVVLTPHGAGYSTNGVELRWRHSIETVIALARRRWPPSCVNPTVRPQRELRPLTHGLSFRPIPLDVHHPSTTTKTGSRVMRPTIHRRADGGHGNYRIPIAIALAIASQGFGARGAHAADPPLGPHDITTTFNLHYGDESCKPCVLDIAAPNDRRGKPRPAIVVIHGGGWIEGDKSSFATVAHGVPGNIEDFARLGFVAATINYRLSGAAPFPAALDDCRSAIRWLRAHANEYHVDVNHVGAYGNSAGGHLALLLAMMPASEPGKGPGSNADQSSQVQAAVSDSGPLDLLRQQQQNQLRGIIERFMQGPPDAARLDTYKRASPTTYVSAGAKLPPMLLIYGEVDSQVDVRTADDFVAALSHAGHKDLSYVRLANVDHCPHSLIRIPYLQEVVSDFFARTLKLANAEPGK